MGGVLWATAEVNSSSGTAAATGWRSYQDNNLRIELEVPSSWYTSVASENTLVFESTSAGMPMSFRIFKSANMTASIDTASGEITEDNPKLWKRRATTVGGRPAVSLTGAYRKDSAEKIVFYFVKASDGYYSLQCHAPAARWTQYQALFSRMLNSLRFLKETTADVIPSSGTAASAE